MNNLTNYMILADRTNKDGELIESNKKVISALVTQLPCMIQAADAADRIKAALVYGEKLRDTGLVPEKNLELYQSPKDKEMLHALLGLVSEAGELCEAFYTSMINHTPLDETNAIEELGDLLWFMALFAKNLNTDLDNIARINIDKLRVRYPEKFSEELALNRDLEGEQNALKG